MGHQQRKTNTVDTGTRASPALRMRAATPDIQPQTPSSNDY